MHQVMEYPEQSRKKVVKDLPIGSIFKYGGMIQMVVECNTNPRGKMCIILATGRVLRNVEDKEVIPFLIGTEIGMIVGEN